MDVLVYILFEVAGTSGSFCTALTLISPRRNNYSFLIAPVYFTCSFVIWFFISDLNFVREKPLLLQERPSYIQAGVRASGSSANRSGPAPGSSPALVAMSGLCQATHLLFTATGICKIEYLLPLLNVTLAALLGLRSVSRCIRNLFLN
jgi:hypothetical protein